MDCFHFTYNFQRMRKTCSSRRIRLGNDRDWNKVTLT